MCVQPTHIASQILCKFAQEYIIIPVSNDTLNLLMLPDSQSQQNLILRKTGTPYLYLF